MGAPTLRCRLHDVCNFAHGLRGRSGPGAAGRRWVHDGFQYLSGGVLTPLPNFAATARLGCQSLASHRSNAEIPAGVNARRDYNAEGRRLVEALGLQVGGNYNAMDAIWKESSTGGKIYVGNETAARGPASTLAEHGITHVVNCTDDMANFCEGACVPLNLLS